MFQFRLGALERASVDPRGAEGLEAGVIFEMFTTRNNTGTDQTGHTTAPHQGTPDEQHEPRL